MRNERGVTLIELLIVILIMVGISTLVFQLFDYTSNMTRAVAQENELQREARFLMETISHAVRDGGTIETNPTTNEIVIANKFDVDQITYNPTTGNLLFVPGNSILSENVESLTVSKRAISYDRQKVVYSLELELRKNEFLYKVSTEVFNDVKKRVRY